MPDVPIPANARPAAAGRGRWGRLTGRWTSSQGEVEAGELLDAALDHGATPIGDCAPGARVMVSGTLRSVTLRPRGGVLALEAELYDGSGRLTLVWLGRRRIRGIEPGRSMTVTGRITHHTDRPRMFNPRYALRPRASA